MPSLIKNREVFNSVANTDVISSSAPNGDVGVSKTVGERGFFIKSQTTFALWFKDGSGVWNISDNNATTGFYEWGANQSFYIQSDSNASFFVFKRKVTPTPRANVVRANKTIRNRTFDTATSHNNIASSWTTSGHSGVPYSIGLFGIDGASTYLYAPPSGQREGKFLGWDDNGDLGWIVPPVVNADVMGETAGIENEGTLNGGAYFSNTGAVVLNGTDGYVQTDDNYHFPDQFQVGANIKPTNLDNEFQTIAGTRNYDHSANGFLLLIKDGMIRATGPQADNFVLDAPIPNDIDMEDGEYHEVKLKWIEDTELTIFLDGEPIGTHTPSGAIRGGIENMEIGRNPKNQNLHFEGEIDGVKVTNEVQTEEEILNEFIAKVLGNTPSPVDYNGIEDLQTTTMENGASLVNGYLALNGNNYAQADSNHHYGDYLTATAWFRTVKHESSLGVLFSSRKWNGSGNGFALAIKNNGVHLHHPQTNNTHIEPTFDHVELSDGEWHQAVLRWKANEDLSAFVDGVKVGSLVPAGGINAGAFDLLIGTEPHGFTGMFVGHIDGVKVENVYKSDNEIISEFTKTPLISLLGNNPMTIAREPGANLAANLDPGATAIDHPDGDLTANISSDWDSVIGLTPDEASYTVTYSVADSDGNVTNLTRNVEVLLIGEKTDYDGIEDLVGTTMHNNAELLNGVLSLDGTGYAVSDSKHWYADHFHVSVWFKTSQAGLMLLVENRRWAPGHNGFTIFIEDNKICTHHPQSNDRLDYTLQGDEAIKDNQWHKIDLKWVASTELTIYLDGQKKASTVPPANAPLEANVNVHIGVSTLHLNYNFVGYIDSVLVQNVIKTDAEVLSDYRLELDLPSLTLLGDSPLAITSLPATDPGATAMDATDGDLTAQITSDWDSVVGANPDNGSYTVAYSVADSDGNVTNLTRDVEVAVSAIYPDNVFIEEWPFRATPIGTATEGVIALNGDEASIDKNIAITIPGSEFAHITDTYTISFWYKKPAGTGVGTFFSGGGITLKAQHGQGTSLTYTTGTGLNNKVKQGAFGHINDWANIIITVSTDDQNNCESKMYVNGNLFDGLAGTVHTWTKSGDLDWSGDVVLHPKHNKQIDSFEIVDYALSETGAANVYAGGRGTAMGDVIQSYDPVVYNLTHEPILDGPSSKAFMDSNRSNTDLYAFNAWMNTNHAPLDNPCNDKYTFSVWFKVSGGYGPLVVTHYDAQSTGIWLESTNGGLQYGTPNGTNTTYNWPVDKDTSFADGEWHHIVATFDHAAGTRALYLDGVRLTGGDDTFVPNSGNPNNEHLLFYARWGSPQRYGYQGTPGRYGNIHLVNYVLTDSQIADIYNAGYLGITIEDGNVPSAPAGYVEDVEDGNGTIVATSNWDAIIGASPAAGNYTVTYSATDSHGGTTDLDVTVVVLEQEAIPLLNPNLYFDGSSLDAIVGNNSLVLAANTSIDSSNGKYGNNSYSYGATGDKLPITFENSVDTTSGTYTFSMWFYNARDTSEYRAVLRQATTGMPVNTRRLPIIIGPNNELGHQLQGTLTWTGYDMTPHIAQNTWTHLAVVADGTDSKYYINGVFVGTAAGVIETAITELGSYAGNNGDATFAEGLDEIAYWARALSDDEIYTIGATDLPLLEIDTLLTAPPPTVITANLEESYPDAQGVSQPVTVHENGQLVDGMYADSTDGEDHVSGVFTDNLRPVAEDVGFSFSAFYRTHPDSNMGSNTSTHHLFDCQDFNNNAGWKLYVNPHFDTRWNFGLEMNGLTLFSTGHIEPLDAYAGKFHHVAFTSKDGVIKVYYNGVLVHTENGVTFLPDVPAHGEYRIGNDFMSRFATDKVTIYKNHVLTQEEITALQDEKAALDFDYSYNFPTNFPPIPAVYFDGSSEEAQLGDFDFVPSNISGFLNTSNGKYGNNSFFYMTTGQNKSSALSPSMQLDAEYTFSFWFYNMRPGSGTHKNILSAGPAVSGGANGHVAYVHQGNGLLRQHVGSTKETGYNIVNAGLAVDTWHHMVIVAEGGGTTMYINNVQVGNKTNAIASGFIKDFGGITGASQTFAEGMDEFAYWPVALTIEQINNIYNSELPLSDLNSWVEPPPPPLEQVATLHNGATLTDGVLELDPAQNSYVVVPHSPEVDVDVSDTTMHLWFYPESTNFPGGHSQTFFGKHNTGSPNWEGLSIGFADRAHPSHGGGGVGFKVFSCNGHCTSNGNNTIFRPAGGITLNQWHHFAITYNESNNVHTVYYDGQPVSTWTKLLPKGTTQDLVIGGSTTNGRTFDGKLKKIYIEKSLLSDAEILAIYNAG